MSVLPPFPRPNKHGSYASGPGSFWWSVWKEYNEEGGQLGYANWLEANKMLARKRKQRVKK